VREGARETFFCGGIVGLCFQIILVGLGGVGLLLYVETLGEAEESGGKIGLKFEAARNLFQRSAGRFWL